MSAVLRFLLARLAEAAATLLALITLCFALLHAAPGGPFDSERSAAPEVLGRLNARFHLDESLPRQYLRYLGDLLHGDLGPSFQYPDFGVNELIASGLPVSLATGGAALLLAFGFGLPLGIAAAWRRGQRWDKAISSIAAIGVSIPKLVAAPLLILVFAVWLGWLPAGGYQPFSWRHLLLPTLALALPHFAAVVRIARSTTISVLAEDYIRAARARGIEGRALLVHHVLRPTLLPILAFLSPALIAVLSGSTVIEQVFGIPGMGRYFVQGALNRDYTLVMGVAIVIGVLIVTINLLVDAARALLDPRLRDAHPL